MRSLNDIPDPLGRVIRSLPLGAEGVLDSALPQPVERTLYSRTGDLPVAVVLVALAVVARIRRLRK